MEEAAEEAAEEREEMTPPPGAEEDWAWAETAPRARTARMENFILRCVVGCVCCGGGERGVEVGECVVLRRLAGRVAGSFGGEGGRRAGWKMG